jgi:DUF4097 and DUF4098 domain-containing protein YvlB
MKKFLEDLKVELNKNGFTTLEISEILQDHEEMINEAIADGLSEEEIPKMFGSPSKLADDLKETADSESDEVGIDKEVGYALVKTYLPSDKELEFNVKLVNEDIKVLPSKSGNIEIHAKNYKEKDYIISFEDNVLTLKKKSKIGFSMNFKKGTKFKLYFPQDNGFSLFNFITTNGDASLKHINGSEFKVKSVNGDVSIKDSNLKTTNITTVNGDIKINKSTTEDFTLSLVSGDVKAKDVTISNECYIHTVSGDADLKDVTAKNISFRSVSGDLKAKECYPETVSLQSVSGDIVIENKNKEHHIEIVKKKTLSGDISIS